MKWEPPREEPKQRRKRGPTLEAEAVSTGPTKKRSKTELKRGKSGGSGGPRVTAEAYNWGGFHSVTKHHDVISNSMESPFASVQLGGYVGLEIPCSEVLVGEPY